MIIRFRTVSFYLVIITTPLLLTLGCTSRGPGELRTHTSKPRPVDPRADNARVLSGLVPGLVVALDIDGEEISLEYAQVFMVPQSKPRRQEGELITLTGMSQGKAVSSLKVSDHRLVVQESFKEQERKGRIVIPKKRSVTAALPLPVRIDTLEVRLPGKAEPARLNVRKAIEEFCNSYRQMSLCQSEKQ